MENLKISIDIKTPELIVAINALAAALDIKKGIATPEEQPIQTATPTTVVNQNIAPVQPVPVQPVPVQPVPVQPVPVQPVPMQQSQPIPNPVDSAAPSTPVSVVPTTVQTYSMEQLAVAATQIVDAGRRTDLVALLNSFGVQALTALPKEQYGAFATQLRGMGAKI